MSQGIEINLFIRLDQDEDLDLGWNLDLYLCSLLILFFWRPLMDPEP